MTDTGEDSMDEMAENLIDLQRILVAEIKSLKASVRKLEERVLALEHEPVHTRVHQLENACRDMAQQIADRWGRAFYTIWDL